MAGVAVLASGGSALAFGATGATLATSGTVTVFPGQTAQALDSISLAVVNGTWVAGDFVTFELSSTSPATTEICNTASNSLKGASFSAVPTVTAVDTGGATITAPVTVLSAGANCNVNDKFTLPLPTPPGDTGTTTLTIAGLKVTLGSAVPATAIDIAATASNGTPFAGSITAGVVEGTIGTASISSPSIGVSGAPVTVTVGPIKVTDVTGGQLSVVAATLLHFTLTAGNNWGSVGTLTVPAGVTISTAGSIATNVLTFGVTGASPAGGVFTLTGATANIIAAPLGARGVTVTTTASAVSLATQVAFVGTTTREGGADRYGTAALLFNSEFGANPTKNVPDGGTLPTTYTPATTAVVTSGVNFPDALSSSFLAGSLKTGILLTDPNVLSGPTKTVLTNGKINTVYIVGGTAAVSQAVENTISGLFVGNSSSNGNLTVIRIAGADRYATNFQVVLNGGVSGSTSGNTAIIATGANFADALAAGPAAAFKQIPIILTDPATLSATASTAIAALGVSHAIIVGGTAAVSTAVETALGTAGVTVDLRLAGADRTETAAMIGEWESHTTATAFTTGSYTTGHLGLGFVTTTVDLSRGDNYPDALAAGPVLGAVHTGGTAVVPAITLKPEVLLLSGGPTALGTGVGSFFGSAAMGTTTINGIGLASALSGSVLGQALGAAS
jgi:putative cell wall-binding protein